MCYSRTSLRTVALETASQIALRNCPREVKNEPGYIGVFAEKTKKQKHVVEHQKITARHRNRHLKLMILVLFYVWEDARVWAH